MTKSSHSHSDASKSADSGSAPDLSALSESFFEVQSNQWNALVKFQESLATFYKDFWEQWACRFAGGVSIDG